MGHNVLFPDAGAVSVAEVLRAPGLEGPGPTEDPVQEILPGIDQQEQGGCDLSHIVASKHDAQLLINLCCLPSQIRAFDLMPLACPRYPGS